MNRPNNTPDTGCTEYRDLTRRQFLSGAAKAAAIAATTPAWLPRVAMAQNATSRDILVFVYMRGGLDCLSMCVPHGEGANYYDIRPNIGIPNSQLLPLTDFFSFPKSMEGLYEAYQQKHLLVVHATGSHDPTRSHFDAMRFMEVGKPQDPLLYTGWLGRHLQSMPPLKAGSFLRGIDIDWGLQQSLVGAPQTLPIPYPQWYDLGGYWETTTQRKRWLHNAYSRHVNPVKASALDTENTIQMLNEIDFEHYTPGGGATYPDTFFGNGLKSIAAIIKADKGLEVAEVDIGGFDSHSGQGGAGEYLWTLLKELADSLGAFHKDIFSMATPNVTVVCVSEFGRNIRENGSKGTDHGHGCLMMAMGEHINGGQVLTQWPGLAEEFMYEGQDLQVTIDHRDILAEIVKNRLGNSNLSFIFPGYTPTFRGVTK